MKLHPLNIICSYCCLSLCFPTPTAPLVTTMTSLPAFTSLTAFSTIAAMRIRDGYPSGVETMLVPALITMRLAFGKSARVRML